MNRKVKVAAARLAPAFLDRDARDEKARSVILEAGKAGAELVAFPDTFLPGYPFFAVYLPPTQIEKPTTAPARRALQGPRQTISSPTA
jgi:nitrilase